MAHTPDHFDALARLLQLEHQAERAQLQELGRSLTLQERAERGHVWLDLESERESVGLGGRVLVTLVRADGRPLPTLPHHGDEVSVRPRRSDEVEPARATVSQARPQRITLAFDRPPPPFVREGRLKLERVANDTTYQRTLQNLTRMKARDKGVERRVRDVLLGQLPPRFNRPSPVDAERPLNPEQADAVSRALAAEDWFLVHGPPGTGKSTVLSEIAAQAVARGHRLLATAASNAAVDHLLELCVERGLRTVRIGHPARVLASLQHHTLDLQVEDHPDHAIARELFDEAFALEGYSRRQRTQGRSRERFGQARESRSEARRLRDEARALERKAVRDVLARAEVVCVTLGSLGTSLLAGETFDLALLDEATQATEPLALGAFLHAPRVILAGDHQQLPPTVLSPQAAEEGLSRSLFERLHAEGPEEAHHMLREQYRMHAEIMAFPNARLYGGALRAHPSVAERTLAQRLPSADAEGLDAPPVLFLDTAGKGFEEEQEPGTGSLFNPGEAALIAARVRALVDAGLPPAELGVIAPYSAQAARLRELLSAYEGLEVDTVDAFQGREKEAILISLVRSNGEGQVGFLGEIRRMNVALTRAKRHVFVVGDSATLGGHPFYGAFIERTQETGGYRSAWEWPDPQEP
ncbi:MAG TPA: AAA domain-containing protein [Myxococcaceae bacterium]|nr:AAA domain-containing protein [Myxococcaceae bacterium]